MHIIEISLEREDLYENNDCKMHFIPTEDLHRSLLRAYMVVCGSACLCSYGTLKAGRVADLGAVGKYG